MEPSSKVFDLITFFEGCELEAYLDTADPPVPTIGWGTTIYKTGIKVKLGDTITGQQADDLLRWQVGLKSAAVNGLNIQFNQNQFDAMVDFAYNEGITRMRSSTLVRKMRLSLTDPSLHAEFDKWIYAGGKKSAGLLRRREAEYALFISPV